LPVFVFEEALVELARRVTREFGSEIHTAWALHIGKTLATVRDELCGQCSGFSLVAWHVDGLYYCLDLFAKILIRDPEDCNVAHSRVHGQHVLRLLRVNIYPAANDHVGLPVRKV
jgi:hypothetical protein